MLTEAVIYTDGSSGRGGDGGWAAIVATPHFGVEIYGHSEGTTNNRMEMTAALQGMTLLEEPHKIDLVADSDYLLKSIRYEWYRRWFEEKYARANLDLWRLMAVQLEKHKVSTHKVKGHDGHEFNERVDELASIARKTKTASMQELYGNPIA